MPKEIYCDINFKPCLQKYLKKWKRRKHQCLLWCLGNMLGLLLPSKSLLLVVLLAFLYTLPNIYIFVCPINVLPLHSCNGILFLVNAAINYIAICEALGVSPSVIAAGVAADNVICAVYFVLLFALVSKIPPEASKVTDGMYN